MVRQLVKPSWTPAPSTISLIWMILYPVILVSFGFVFVKAFRARFPAGRHSLRHQPRRQPAVHADLFGAEERAAGGGGHRDRLGHDHLVCHCSLAAFHKWVGAQAPYFVWVSIASVLQLSITAMNWGRP